jgi:heme-degrading monooxygenase HmoA
VYIQVITYSLEGIDEEEYLDVANELAARIAGVPGLLAKLWLENSAGNRYGGIYFWDDLESMQRFGQSDLFEGRVPEFADSVVEEFGLLENLTAMTQPVLEILEPRRGPAAAAPAPAPAPALAAPTAQAAGVAARQPSVRKRTPPPRKAPGTSTAARVSAAKKAATEKVAVKKAAAKRAAPKKAAPKKVAVKKAPRR